MLAKLVRVNGLASIGKLAKEGVLHATLTENVQLALSGMEDWSL